MLNVVPVDGDDLVFPTTTGPQALTNDLPNLLVRSLSFTSARTITGNAIRLQAGVTVTQVTPTFTVSLAIPIQLTGAQTWTTVGAGVEIVTPAAGTIDLNGSALTLNASTLNSVITLNGVISGAGEVIKNGPAHVTLTGVNTYTGPTRVNMANLHASPAALGVGDGTMANGTTVANGAILRLFSGVFPPEALELNGNLIAQDGTVELPGPVTLTGTITASPTSGIARVIFSGVVSGAGRLKTGMSGIMTLRNTNTYTGGTEITQPLFNAIVRVELEAHEAMPLTPLQLFNRDEVVINKHRQSVGDVNSTTGGAFILVSGATPAERGTLILAGAGDADYNGQVTGNGLIRHTGTGRQVLRGNNTGLTGLATVEQGTLELGSAFYADVEVSADARLVLSGTAHTTGALTVNGGTVVHSVANTQSPSLTMTNAEWESVAQPNTLSRFTVVGAVSLGNSTLSLQLPSNFSAPLNSDLVLVDHVQAGPVNGAFAGLPEGAEFRVGKYTFRITYAGGDGNDILLRVLNISRDYLLSEGATGGFFTTDILIANPTNTAAPTQVQFFPTGGAPITVDISVAALSRTTIRANDVAGLEGAEFSTQVRSTTGSPLIVERTMSWDATGYGAHGEHAAETLSNKWYFAEGSQGFFQTYLQLANPQDTANVATVRYLRDGGWSTVERTYELTPRSRRTIDLSADADLVNKNFGMEVTFAQPGMCERAMYFGTTPLFTGGHESSGATSVSQSWFVAEGATGPFFETFILLANPNNVIVDATLTFLPQGDSPIQRVVSIAPGSRITLNLEQQSPALANAAVATQVQATGAIVVERAQYWPDPAPNWYEAHNSFGVTALQTRWGLAEGRVGLDRGYETFILLANPGSTTASVTITFLREGQPSIQKVFDVPPASRLNVRTGPGTEVPELNNERFGALIVSTQPIAVERAMYSSVPGQVFAAGTSATAVPVP